MLNAKLEMHFTMKVLTKIRDHAVFFVLVLDLPHRYWGQSNLGATDWGKIFGWIGDERKASDVKEAALEATLVPRLRGLEYGRRSLNSELHTEAGKRYVRSRKSIV